MSYPEPVYRGPDGDVTARVLPAAAEPDLRLGGTEVRYLLRGAETNGLFGLYRWDMPPGQSGAAPHFHRTITETFFVLSGAPELYDGTRWKQASPGDCLYVPEGGLHGFGNPGTEAASMLLLFSPGAPREGYFETLAEVAAGRELTGDQWADLFEQHDNHYV